MFIVTSENLFKKYPGHEDELHALLEQLAPRDNIHILPNVDYLATKSLCDTLNDSLLIIGGIDVIPMADILNPTADNDTTVPTDNPYACVKDTSYLIPDKVVSRIPDEQINPTFEYIQTVLTNQIKWNSAKTTNTGWFHICAKVWEQIGNFIHNAFGMDELNVSPDITYINLKPEQYNKRMAYINLHGGHAIPGFYNQNGSVFNLAMTPMDGNFNGTLVFCEACYSGELVGRNKSNSIALMALHSNAIGWVGSSTIAFGSSMPPLSCADSLSYHFFQNVLAGQNLGTALMNAKIQFASDTIKQNGTLSGTAKKTLLQFHLYSHPGIVM